MRIAVLNSYNGSVDVFNAPDFETTEEIEAYLSDERGYSLSCIDWMSGVLSINIE